VLSQVAGHLIYDSSKVTSRDLVPRNDKVIYLDLQPAHGISAALNASQAMASSLFPDSTHYCYVHSRDKWTLNNDILCSILSSNALAGLDAIFGGYANTYIKHTDYFLPCFSKILTGMTVSHVGAIISHHFHHCLGGYRNDYLFAMDYDFFLRGSKNGFVYKEYSDIFVDIDMTGVSSDHPYRALFECSKSRLQAFPLFSSQFSLGIVFSLIAIVKRLIYEFMSFASPSTLSCIRKRINQRLLFEERRT